MNECYYMSRVSLIWCELNHSCTVNVVGFTTIADHSHTPLAGNT